MPPPLLVDGAGPGAEAAAPSAGDPLRLGRAVRDALAGVAPPFLAVQTTASFLGGTVAPERWALALAGLHGWTAPPAPPDRRGGNHPARAHVIGAMQRATAAPPPPVALTPPEAGGRTPWAAVADLGDLAGLPACIEHWGHHQVAVGASVPLGGCGRAASLVLALAPDAGAYRRLCQWLSWRHEDADGWTAWQDGRSHHCPPLDGIVVLSDDAAWIERLRWHGAEVLWRLADAAAPAAPAGCDAVLAPLLTDLDGGGACAAGLLAAIQDRSRVRAHAEAARARPPACALSDLPALLAAGAGTEAALERGRALLARCAYTPGRPQADGTPCLHLPPSPHADPDAELRRLCVAGLAQRYGDIPDAAVLRRLDHELAVIARKRFAAYVLTVHALAQNRRTCGRGSAASSLVCYLIGLTNVDPVRYRLVFERFLADERTDPPDIDIDFPWDERDAVLATALVRYGADHVAMVATHQGIGRDGARREAGRALGFGRAAITSAGVRRDLAERFAVGPGAGPAWDAVEDAAAGLVGACRGYGLHCGGVVITAQPLRDLVPVHPAAKQVAGRPMPAIAWEKDGAEALGLVKIDLLGNRSLAVVRDAVADLRADGIAIDERRWRAEDDLLARRLVAEGRTIGCFYIESPAMRLLQAKAGASGFDQLVVHSSIIRPAAMRWIDTYLERLHEFRRTGVHRPEWYPHPALGELLSESFGVLSYQEDVMRIAGALAGFGSPEQNRLRKALGRSDTPQRLQGLADAFFAGCAARAVAAPVAEHVWAMITSFSGYSFTKAHSASYAAVSYQCAWLKAHHPAHFLARVIHNGGGFYQRAAYVEEARRCGLAVLPPCVVAGEAATVRAGATAIRLGWSLVAGLRQRSLAALADERSQTPFAGIADCRRRCRLNARELHALHDAGALDALAPTATPAQRAWLVDAALHAAPAGDPDQLRFDFAVPPAGDPCPPAGLAEPSQRVRDQRAWAALACLPRAHPFALWGPPPRRTWRCTDVHPRNAGRQLALHVLVITSKEVIAEQHRDRAGRPLSEPSIRPMAFVTLEDEHGIAESVWFPDAYRACGALIGAGRPLWVTGRVEVEFDVATLSVQRAVAVGD